MQSQTAQRPARSSSARDSRYIGVSTRQDQIRALLAATNPRYRARQLQGLARRQPTLVEIMLDQRNLLSPRSNITRNMLGQDYYGIGDASSEISSESLPMNIAGSPASRLKGGEAVTSDFLDLYEQQLSRRADDYYEIGVAYFAAGEFAKAKSNFQMDREIHRDSARAYIADVFCALEQRDMNRARFSLIMAFKRAESPEGLKVDISKFYPDPMKLERTMNVLGVVESQSTDIFGPALLLAYCSWLDGDLISAQQYMTKLLADPSMATMNKDLVEAVIRFGRFIDEARSAPAGGGDEGIAR
ncbi:MAG: hypothetical protein HS101_08410 [Planctomycetia bacterium]|nr:hypothetical protein [Planctomycetia bacterium]MCC7316567.1 hypothetical protein [Planctomycetota bacterium]